MADVSPIPYTPRPLRQLLGPLGISASGMTRQQKFMEVIAKNIANADVIRTADGGPYQRQIAVAGIDPKTGEPTTTVQTVKGGGDIRSDPNNPQADAEGNVHYPNVDVETELADMMIARRMHEANATVFQATKAMLRRALEI